MASRPIDRADRAFVAKAIRDKIARREYALPAPLPDWQDAPEDSVYQVGTSVGDLPKHLSKLPKYISDAIAEGGATWHITDKKVGDSTSFMTDPYANAPVSGWPTMAYRDLPGVYQDSAKSIILSSNPQNKNGSSDMDLHESRHGFDDVEDRLSQLPAFQSAYDADKASLSAYYNQPDRDTSLREAFAESFARYYGGDPTFHAMGAQPKLYNFVQRLDAAKQAESRLPRTFKVDTPALEPIAIPNLNSQKP